MKVHNNIENFTPDKDSSPLTSVGPVERFIHRRNFGEIALITIFIGVMLFVGGVTIGAAIANLSV